MSFVLFGVVGWVRCKNKLEVPELESVEDPFNDSLDFSGLCDENGASNIIPPVNERCTNFKRKSDTNFDKCSKKTKQN